MPADRCAPCPPSPRDGPLRRRRHKESDGTELHDAPLTDTFLRDVGSKWELASNSHDTDETLVRCVETVKAAAEKAGRNPDQVKVWSCFATIGDHNLEEQRLRKTVGRLATYLQGYRDLLVATNRWDPGVLQRFREDSVVRGFTKAACR